MRSKILSRFVIKGKKEDVLHSSGYARVQNRAGFGATSTESFEKRREIDLHRKLVKGYGDSRMVNDMGRHTAQIRAGLKKDLEKREARFGNKDEKGNKLKNNKKDSPASRRGTDVAGRRAALPRKNPGIFR